MYITMIINNIENINQKTFTSKRRIIRKADDMARRINRRYTRVSCSNIADFKNIIGHENVYNKLAEQIDVMRKLILSEMKESDSYLSKVSVLPKLVSEYKLGNCDESAKLALIGAKVNDINDCRLGQLFSVDSGQSLDHLVLFVQNGENPYIIDPWLGFADYEANAIQKYKNEFNYHFSLNGNPKEHLVFEPSLSFFGLAVDKVPLKKLKSSFKELILPKPYKKSFGSNIKGKFKTIYLWFKNKFNL